MIRQRTVNYKTYLKRAVVHALRGPFVNHPDQILRATTVDTDFSQDLADYPRIIVRFYERKVKNAGVGHIEWLPIIDSNPLRYQKFKHALYSGDLEYAIYAKTSLDRDLVSDALIEILTMGDLTTYAQSFFDTIYSGDTAQDPTVVHYVNINTDEIQGFGETQAIAPWLPEDQLIYQTSYRVGVFGEFYSRIPDSGTGTGFVEDVELYPYDPSVGETRPNPNPNDPGEWIGTEDTIL